MIRSTRRSRSACALVAAGALTLGAMVSAAAPAAAAPGNPPAPPAAPPVAGPKPAPPAPPASSPFVKRVGPDLHLKGKPFKFAGTNNYYLHYKSAVMRDAVLERASDAGFQVVRTWGWFDIGTLDGRCRPTARRTAPTCSTGTTWPASPGTTTVRAGSRRWTP